MKHLRSVVILIQFMTTIPLGFKGEATSEDYGKALVFGPVVGILLGIFLSALAFLMSFLFPPVILAVLIFAGYVLLTGGLHLDGLGDTFDGIFSGRSKERILEIMRDSRIGTNGLLAILLVTLLNVALISSIFSEAGGKYFYAAILLTPVAGRIGSLTAASFSKYARNTEGLGKSFIDFCGKREFLKGLILYLIIFFSAGGIMLSANWSDAVSLIVLFFASLVPPVSAFALVKFLGRRVGGATGDILGAVCELNQTIFLIVAYLLSGIM